MRKHVFSVAMVATVMAVVTFASPSSAQRTEFFALAGPSTLPGNTADFSSGLTTVAREVFGPGSADTVVTIWSGVDLTLTADFSGATNSVNQDREAIFTFELLDGVQFGEDVGRLGFSEGGTDQPTKISLFDTTGGEEGDSSVSYSVRAEQQLNHATSVFTFDMPKIMNAAFLGNADTGGPDNDLSTMADNVPPHVRVKVSVAQRASRFPPPNGFPTFPKPEATPSELVANPDTRIVLKSETGFPLTITPEMGRTVNIDIDNRTSLVPGDGVVTVTGPDFGDAGRNAIAIGTLDINRPAPVPNGADNMPLNPTSGDLVTVVAMGPFAAGDTIFFSEDNVLTPGESSVDTVLTLTGTTATSTVRLSNWSMASDESWTLYVVPGDDRTVNRGQYTARFQVNFSAATLRGAMGTSPATVVEYSGLSTQGYAYALPNPGSADVGNLRISCESAAECAVFLDCRNQNGMGVGDFPEITVMPMATRVFNTKSVTGNTSLAAMLGVETWTGRLSCEILTNADIGVQILTRSGGTLVNNTYISGAGAPAATE